MSLDYLQSNDYEMASNVLGAVDMIKEIVVHSDKCTLRELQKCGDEFNKDLKKLRFKSRVNIWKYIKDAENPSGKKDEDEDDDNET